MKAITEQPNNILAVVVPTRRGNRLVRLHSEYSADGQLGTVSHIKLDGDIVIITIKINEEGHVKYWRSFEREWIKLLSD